MAEGEEGEEAAAAAVEAGEAPADQPADGGAEAAAPEQDAFDMMVAADPPPAEEAAAESAAPAEETPAEPEAAPAAEAAAPAPAEAEPAPLTAQEELQANFLNQPPAQEAADPELDDFGVDPLAKGGGNNSQLMPAMDSDEEDGGGGGPGGGMGGLGGGDDTRKTPPPMITPGAPKAVGEPKGDDRLIKVKGLDKQQLCIDLLMVGCVQSFVDFFYITHRKSATTEGPLEQESKDVEIPEDTLIFLKETLETAESARRAKNYQHCFESYNALAEYFEKVPDLKSAMYFYQRCADVASEVDARESIAKANLNLGTCEEQANNWQSAMKFHEHALQLATSADALPLQIKAASHLTHVYQVLAEQCEKESRDKDATKLYESCLSCAQLSKDATLEGTACHKLGLSKHKTGHFEQAVELQKQYLDICRMHDDRVGESAARAALAHAYEATGNTQEAIKQLENLLNVASEAGELKAQASACLNLGILYNGRGDHEKSVELLEQHFDLARQLGDRRLIDSARVVLGMVRGSGKLKSYIDLVNNDLDKLLRWKSKRAALDSA